MLFRSDRKSTRLNSSHLVISYAVFCLKKKTQEAQLPPCRQYGRGSFNPSLASIGLVAMGRRAGTCRSRRATRWSISALSFFFNDTGTPEIYTLPLHDALPF